MAGSVLGSGAAGAELESQIRGLAYRARLVFQAVEQEVRWRNPQNLLEYGRYILAIPDDLTPLFKRCSASPGRDRALGGYASSGPTCRAARSAMPIL